MGDLVLYETDVERAIQVALIAHRGVLDKVGLPYILHPLAVGVMGHTPNEMIVGFLHDTVEDTWLGLSDIEMLFNKTIRDAVDSVTKREGETYREFVERASLNPIGRVVKANDMRHNMSRTHPDPAWKASMDSRYRRGLNYLETGRW